MGLKKMKAVLAGLIAISLFTIPLSFGPITGSSWAASEWAWTKENPKPVWWTWDKDYWPEEPVRGGILKLAASSYIGLMNPNHWPVNDWNAMTYFYDFLIYNDGNFKPTVLFLAESYKYLDPLTVVMKVREGVKYHDGADFNAEALKYQVDWIKDRANGCWSRAWLEPIKSVEIMDEFTVKFHFERAWAGFAGIFATVPGFMISPKALKNDVLLGQAKTIERKVATARNKADKAESDAQKVKTKGSEEAEKAIAKAEKLKKEAEEIEAEAKALAEQIKGVVSLDQRAVGTGKYMYDEASPGNYLRYKRNPDWWFGRSVGKPEMPYPDGVLITVIPDPAVQLANLRAGQVHFIGLTKSYYNLVKNDPNLVIQFSTWPHVNALRFNTQQGACKDIRVRKAISHAIDRQALIAGIQFGLATPASGMYPAKHWAHNTELKPVSFDPELSKKLLTEAGYPNGLTIKGYMSNLPDPKSIAEAVKSMLAQVGVNWDVQILDTVATSDKMKNLDYDLAEGGWAYIWDPDMMATGLYHPDGGFNFGRSHNEEAIALIEKGKSEVDYDKRQKIYWQLSKLIYDNYEDAWLWYPQNIAAYRKNVAGFNQEFYDIGLEGYYHSHPIWLKDGGKRSD